MRIDITNYGKAKDPMERETKVYVMTEGRFLILAEITDKFEFEDYDSIIQKLIEIANEITENKDYSLIFYGEHNGIMNITNDSIRFCKSEDFEDTQK
jgi:hypothetical protein